MKRWIVLWLLLVSWCEAEVIYREDDSATRAIKERDPRSHIKIFLPAMPYVSVARLINEGLVRLADNEQGWEYSLATHCDKRSEKLYECELRKGVHFQDGSPFNADAVVNNFKYFQAQPINYTDIQNRLKQVEKLSEYSIRIELHKPYGMLFRDLARINFYTETYLKKFEWRGAATGPNIEEAGPYGLGPYILVEGVITGRKQTPKAVLKANPYYWEKGFPKIETITLYTQLETDNAMKMITERDGELDFMPIPFNKKIEAMLSSYSKLVVIPSSTNFTLYFNLLKSDSPVANKQVRQALNCALNQHNLLTFTYKQEGIYNQEALRRNECHLSHDEVMALLHDVSLNVVTQEGLLFLWKGIEYQLSKYGVTLNYTILTDEKRVYDLLLSNHEKTQSWDILSQNTVDWYGRHPWLTFFNYQEGNPWSFVKNDTVMQGYIHEFFGVDQGSEAFNRLCEKIRERAKEEAYMLYVPTPHNVFAMNKELVFEPLGIGMQPFWKARVTTEHWSMRGETPYPEALKVPILPKREHHEKN